MSIRLVRNGINIPSKIDTLKIKETKSAFSNKLSISKSTHPFIILETPETVAALGPPVLQSTHSVFNDVLFINDNRIYQAELIVRGLVKGGRKCDIIYTNEVFPHLKQKIDSYFPDVTVDGSTPTSYNEQTDVDFTDTAWQGYVENTIPRNFPDVDFNFPSLKFPTKFGDELEPDDNWYAYKGEINQKTNGIVSLNYKAGGLENQNVICPFYYLLAPLYKVFKDELGYTISGDFVEDEAIKCRLLYHKENNLVEITQPANDNSEWLTVFRHHLTIHAKRFLPSWSVAQYINNLKNTWNLSITTNDITKEIIINYNEKAFFKSKPLDISAYNYEKEVYPTNTTNKAYVLQSADGEDYAKLTLDAIENTDVVDDYTVLLKSNFKHTPETLTLDWEGNGGVGLIFYKYTIDSTYNVQEINNQTNLIWGENGIMETCWMLWFRMRLRSKILPLNLICSPKQKADLQLATNIYVFNQEFLLKTTQFEQVGKKYKVKLDLISLSY